MKTYEEKARSALKRIKAEKARRRRQARAVLGIAASAAVLGLAAFLGAGAWQQGLPGPQPPIPQTGSPATEPDPENAYALYTDAIVLPEPREEVAVDIIGCIVYKGHVYVQSADWILPLTPETEDLVGEYLGQAKGTLDEWSSQEDWATEFASTCSGPVYTVTGYGEDFRLGILTEADGEEFLMLFDNYDHIGLTTGADLFDARLHVKGNVTGASYLTHEDWNQGGRARRALSGPSGEALEAFLEDLCGSPFQRIRFEENPDFYDAQRQGHLFLELKDGTTVELRLIDGGYVGLQSLGWFFVKMPGAPFDAVLSACQ